MRIISGIHRGRVIQPPKNLRARPTTDFAKENLFNVLNSRLEIEGLDVLDLFSGTGSISYEFASRGAASVVSVEINAVHHQYIRNTAKSFGFTNIHPVKANAFLYLKKFAPNSSTSSSPIRLTTSKERDDPRRRLRPAPAQGGGMADPGAL